MKNPTRLSLALAGALLGLVAFTSTSARAAADGRVEFKNFLPASVGEVAEIDIHPGLMKFAAKLAGEQSPKPRSCWVKSSTCG